ncbi:MAG TPA: hypothetical protein PLV42_04460 [bacterium]|nr:hypothetical protein [bacterium]
MKRTAYIALCLIAFFAVACSTEDPAGIPTDNGVIGDTDTPQTDTPALPDNDTSVVPDNPGTDTDTPATDDVQPDADVPVGDCETGNVGKNCKTDTECGACNICVNAKCAQGCLSDTDCSTYTGTKCNKKLGRCVNLTAASGACDETKCASGCCYAEKGFTALKCAATASLAQCGICKQGEVYMDGKQCVPSACKVGDTKCATYNASDPNAECFECKAGDLICAEKSPCSTGSALLLLNAKECIPAGETCSENDTCCSGQPCIQGYCY